LSRQTVKHFKNLKIHDNGGHHLDKSKNRHISATVGPITMKCGTLMQFDPLDHSVSNIGLQYCNVDRFMRLMSRIYFQKHSLHRTTR